MVHASPTVTARLLESWFVFRATLRSYKCPLAGEEEIFLTFAYSFVKHHTVFEAEP